MNMSRSELVAELAAVERRGKATRYPPALRKAAVEYCDKRRASGLSWKKIGRSLRANPDTLRRWHTEMGGAIVVPAAALVPVEVVEVQEPASPAPAAPQSLQLTSPGGYRVDGLTVELAAQLLQALL